MSCTARKVNNAASVMRRAVAYIHGNVRVVGSVARPR